MVVQHNMQAMNASRMLGVTTSSQSKATEKLSSGYRINRAADDAAGLTISEKMRKQIRGLDRASTNAQDGISAVQTAEGALTEVHSMLQRMNELAVQASNGTNSEDDRQAIQDEIDQLITEIDRVSETTKFNEIYLLKGEDGTQKTTSESSFTFELTQTAKDAENGAISLVGGAAAVYGAGKTDAVSGAAAATTASMSIKTTALTAGNDEFWGSTDGGTSYTKITSDADLATYFDVADDGTVTAKANTAFKTADSTQGFTATQIAGASGTVVADGTTLVTGKAKADAKTSDIDEYVKMGDDGKLKYQDGKMLYAEAADPDNDYGNQLTMIAEEDLGTYFKSDANPLCDENGKKITDFTSYFENGAYKGGIYRMTDVNGDGELVWDDDKKEIGAEQITDYITVTENKKESTTADPLKFNLHVGAESAGSNKIAVEIQSISAGSIGVAKLKKDGLMTEDDATKAIDTIAEAVKQVSKQRSALGAIQNRLEHTIANLDNVVENTTAAESRIRDTDMADMMVEYSKNNILAQAGQSMLAQANQSTQGVLSLLQ